MATISKRGEGWFVQIRRKGYQPQFRTFNTKAEAEAWARSAEAEIDRRDLPVDHRALRQTSLSDVLRRYLECVTPRKRGAASEALRIKMILRFPVCETALSELRPRMFADYRDKRLQKVKPATVIKELGLFRNALNVARREWGLHIAVNPLELVAKPRPGAGRDRRLRYGELKRLEEALADTRNPIIAPAIRFAIETGLRRGEMLALVWDDIDLRSRTALVRESKNGHPRAIPLTDGALSILLTLDREEGQVFPLSGNALRLSWNRVRERAGLLDLRFHDLRHEAISRFAEMGLSTVELAVISGHRDPRMLFRYAHLRPADLARKLAGRSWESEVRSLSVP